MPKQRRNGSVSEVIGIRAAAFLSTCSGKAVRPPMASGSPTRASPLIEGAADPGSPEIIPHRSKIARSEPRPLRKAVDSCHFCHGHWANPFLKRRPKSSQTRAGGWHGRVMRICGSSYYGASLEVKDAGSSYEESQLSPFSGCRRFAWCAERASDWCGCADSHLS